MFELDPHDITRDPDDEPLWKQIFYLLQTAIVDGKLKPGDRIPSQTETHATYGVTRETARHAVQEIERLRLVEFDRSRRRQGYFVRDSGGDL